METKRVYNRITIEQVKLCLEVLKHLNTEDNDVRDHYIAEAEKYLGEIIL